MLELLARRERAAACRPGDGPGMAPSGAFPGRRTTDSELNSPKSWEGVCPSGIVGGRELVQPKPGRNAAETIAFPASPPGLLNRAPHPLAA
uniref:Uncharacterized protein n=1 Tax=Zea mays TaxID=4577 RepID=A0A804PRB6_MAIZE